jgi:L-ascorbate metabolism protein UlaG (beta-lactamase superfamily)
MKGTLKENNMKTIRILVATLVGALTFAIVTGSLSLPGKVLAQANQDDQIPTTQGNLVIHPVHHGSVVLTWNGKRIVVDPAPWPVGPNSAAVDFRAANPPDLILVTHEHPDHFSVPTLSDLAGPNSVIVVPQDIYGMLPAALQAKAKRMKNGDKGTYVGVAIEAVPAYNVTADRLAFHPKGRDNGYVLTLGGKRVYFAGDVEETPELKSLPNIDVAFVPMNLPYTM